MLSPGLQGNSTLQPHGDISVWWAPVHTCQPALPGKTANWAAIPLPLGGSLATQEQQLVVFSLKEQHQEWRPVFQEELDLSRLPGAEAWRQPLALGTSPGIPRPTREWVKAGL